MGGERDRVIGCALSARAAVELESQAGIDSTTIARLKLDLDRGYGLARHNVLVVDEAGMVGTRALAELSANADAVGAKLVLVGDDRQLPEIDAGGSFRGIAERIGALELHETRRQRHAWDREALSALRDGDLDGWAARYRQTGRLVARPTARMVREELVADWWQAARDESVDAVMITHRRVDDAELNDRARALMAADGRLGDTELDAGGRSFAQGDRVLARTTTAALQRQRRADLDQQIAQNELARARCATEVARRRRVPPAAVGAPDPRIGPQVVGTVLRRRVA